MATNEMEANEDSSSGGYERQREFLQRNNLLQSIFETTDSEDIELTLHRQTVLFPDDEYKIFQRWVITIHHVKYSQENERWEGEVELEPHTPGGVKNTKRKYHHWILVVWNPETGEWHREDKADDDTSGYL